MHPGEGLLTSGKLRQVKQVSASVWWALGKMLWFERYSWSEWWIRRNVEFLSMITSPRHESRTVLTEGALSRFRSVDPISTARAWQSSSIFNGRCEWDTHISTCISSLDSPSFYSLIRRNVSSYTSPRAPPAVATVVSIFSLLALVVSPKIAAILKTTSRNLKGRSMGDPST